MPHPTDDDRIVIESPDHVEVAVQLAGLGSRFLAALLDSVVLAALLTAVGSLLAVVSAVSISTGGWLSGLGSIGLAIAIGVMTLIFFGYHIASEMWMNGQSVGKRALRIRVEKDNGQPIRFFDSVLRNFIRVFEAAAGFYAISVVSMLLSAQRKRLGDFAAGTIVAKVVDRQLPSHLAVDINRLPITEEMRQGVRVGISLVTQEEYEFISDLLLRANELPRQMAVRMAVETGWSLMQKMGIIIPEAGSLSPQTYFVFLQAVAALYAQKSAGL